MNEFEVVSVFRSSVNIYQTCLCLYILYRHCLLNISIRLLFSVLVSGVNCYVHYLILKTNCLASRIKITISTRLHLFCFSCPCLSVSVLKYLEAV